MIDSIDTNLSSSAPPERGFLPGLIFLSLLMGLSIGYSRVITTLFAVQMNAHGWMLAAVALSQSIGMLVLAASAGRWVNVYGARRVFVFGSAWGVIICFLTPLVPIYSALLLFTAAASLAMPPRFVSINTIFMSRLQQLGKQRAGWFRAAHVIGMTFLGALLATALFPRYGPRLAFWCAAIIFALNIGAFVLGIGRAASYRPVSPKKQEQGSLLSLFRLNFARRVAFWEFSIQSLNAYFAFYIVIIVLRYMHLPEQAAGFAVAAQGIAFVFTLVAAGRWVILRPHASRVLGGMLVLIALAGLAASKTAAGIYLCAAVLGSGLGLLQIINLTEFAHLGEVVGFSRAASINALSGPCGGVFGGMLGGLIEHWIAPQPLFLAFVPLFVGIAFFRPRS